MYTLKSIAQRSTLLGAATALLVAAVLPAASVFADALNPLTDRSLTLSSSAPGWDDKDGSGNATYAPPNSGANGQKTGNTFDFKVSSDTTGVRDIKAMTFQYCTTSAGTCRAPGNNPYNGGDDARLDNGAAGTWDSQKSDLNVVVAGGAGTTQAALGTHVTDTSGVSNPNGVVSSIPAANATGGNYMVYALISGTWTASPGWTMTTGNNESGSEAAGAAGGYTGANNQITLAHSGTGFTVGTRVKVVFFGTNTNYITNPGSGAFFVRINHWDHASNRGEANVIDGGVTVANVMNQSIQITTKVLETMDFSVGTVDPYTLEAKEDLGGGEDTTSQLYIASGNRTHGICDPILGSMTHNSDPLSERNRLMLGNETGEFSLETAHTYSTHSYWRLSSNSSAGATVYYSGVTLSNTVGDTIDPIYGSTPGDGLSAAPQVGREQFGIALDNGSGGNRNVDYKVERKVVSGNFGGLFENGDDNTAAGIAEGITAVGSADTSGIHSSVTDDDISNVDSNASWHPGGPQLAPLVPLANYGGGTGTINNNYNSGSDPISTSFAFDETSNLIPVPMASQDSQVVDCVTGKVNYIANIAATTPAGIYTTKVNYIASPQY